MTRIGNYLSLIQPKSVLDFIRKLPKEIWKNKKEISVLYMYQIQSARNKMFLKILNTRLKIINKTAFDFTDMVSGCHLVLRNL